MNLVAAAAGLAAGAGVGVGVTRLNPLLARWEGIDDGPRGWLSYWGPPLLAAAGFAVTGARVGFSPLLALDWLWLAFLVQVVFFDLEHRLILDRLIFPAMAAGLLLSSVTPHLGWKLSLLAGLVAGAVFLLIAVLGSVLLRAEVLGFGDVKLAAFIGLVLGPQLTLDALLVGIMAAGLTSLALVATRVKTLRDTIAYGPYLCLGTMFMLVARGG